MEDVDPLGYPMPKPGYYLVRLVPKGWEVPVHVTASNEGWGVIVDGEAHPLTWARDDILLAYAGSLLNGGLFTHPMLRVVLFGRAVDEGTYNYRLALKEWAALHDPAHPCLSPRNPVNIGTAAPPF